MASATEPWNIQTWPKDGPSPVRIYLWDTKSRETIAHRIICLYPPSYEVKIGRGSQSEHHLRPQEDNAWFTARVMSREHAILRANPETQQITLEDAGSMHGTYVNDTRLEQGRRITVQDDETIRFGTEIVRGELTYVPLELQIQSAWPERPESNPANTRPTTSPRSRNSFSVNYSEDEEDDDDDDDDEIEMIYESNRIAEPDSDYQSRTFSVPDSDISTSPVIEKSNDVHSAPSSPMEMPAAEYKDKPASMPTASEILANKETPLCGFSSIVPGSTFQNAMNVSDDEEEDLQELDRIEEQLENEEVEEGEIGYPSGVSSEDDHSSDEESDESDAECYNDPDQDVEDAFVPMHGSAPTFPVITTQADTRIRAPSPSDAALPKPSWQVLADAPAMQSINDPTPAQTLTYHEQFQADTTMIPPPEPFGCYYGAGWPVGSDNNSAFVGSSDQPFRVYPARHSANWRYPFSGPHDLEESSQPKFPLAAPHVPFQNKPSKVSINDIIDNVIADTAEALETGGTANTPPRKRKANEISTNTVEEELINPVSDQPPMTLAEAGVVSSHDEVLPDEIIESPIQAMEAAATTGSPTDETVLEDVESIIVSPSNPTVVDQDRPSKKVKSEHHKRGSRLFKFAATAAVGAAVGAVGTVLGLAALPAEYFA